MSGEIIVTVIGNLTRDPELRYTNTNSVPVASFSIASTPRTYRDGKWEDGDPVFMNCTAWKDLAENIVDAFRKGQRVIATGRLSQRSYESKAGEKHTVMELTVDDIGVSVKFAKGKSGDGNGSPPGSASTGANTGGYADRPPF